MFLGLSRNDRTAQRRGPRGRFLAVERLQPLPPATTARSDLDPSLEHRPYAIQTRHTEPRPHARECARDQLRPFWVPLLSAHHHCSAITRTAARRRSDRTLRRGPPRAALGRASSPARRGIARLYGRALVVANSRAGSSLCGDPCRFADPFAPRVRRTQQRQHLRLMVDGDASERRPIAPTSARWRELDGRAANRAGRLAARARVDPLPRPAAPLAPDVDPRAMSQRTAAA